MAKSKDWIWYGGAILLVVIVVMALTGGFSKLGFYIGGWTETKQYFPVKGDDGKLIPCDITNAYYQKYLENPTGYANTCDNNAKITVECRPVDYAYILPTKGLPTNCGDGRSLQPAQVSGVGDYCWAGVYQQVMSCSYSDEVRCHAGSCLTHVTSRACTLGERYSDSNVCGWVTASGGCANDPKMWGYDASALGLPPPAGGVLSVSVNTRDGTPVCPALTKKVAAIPEPAEFDISTWSPLTWLSQLGDLLQTFFDKINDALPFSISGPTTAEPGTVVSYTINMNVPYTVANNPANGVYIQRACSAGLYDADKKEYWKLVPENCGETFSKTVSITVPSGTRRNYVVVATMAEGKKVYTNGAWVTEYNGKLIYQEATDLTSKITVVPDQFDTSSWTPGKFWEDVKVFFSSLFGWL